MSDDGCPKKSYLHREESCRHYTLFHSGFPINLVCNKYLFRLHIVLILPQYHNTNLMVNIAFDVGFGFFDAFLKFLLENFLCEFSTGDEEEVIEVVKCLPPSKHCWRRCP